MHAKSYLKIWTTNGSIIFVLLNLWQKFFVNFDRTAKQIMWEQRHCCCNVYPFGNFPLNEKIATCSHNYGVFLASRCQDNALRISVASVLNQEGAWELNQNFAFLGNRSPDSLRLRQPIDPRWLINYRKRSIHEDQNSSYTKTSSFHFLKKARVFWAGKELGQSLRKTFQPSDSEFEGRTGATCGRVHCKSSGLLAVCNRMQKWVISNKEVPCIQEM